MPLHKGGNIELGLLEDLDLADVAVLDGEDAGGLALDLLADGGGDELLDEALEVAFGAEVGHDLDHLGPDALNLTGLGVAGVLDLVVLRLGEGDAEHTDNVSVGGSAVDVALDDGLTLLDERADLVAGHVHTVEVKEAVVSLNILDAKLDLAPGERLIVLEISEGELDDAALESVGGDLGTLGLGDDGLAAVLGGEDGGGNKLVPLLLEEGVDTVFWSKREMWGLKCE